MNVKNLRRNHNGYYQLRLAVPKDLVAKIGKKEKVWALGTNNLPEANTRLPRKREEAEAYFAALRNEFVLSSGEAEGIAERWLAIELERDDADRRLCDYPTYEEGTAPDEVTSLDVQAEWLADKARDGDFSNVEALVEQIVVAEGIVLARGSLSRTRLLEAVLSARVKLLRIQHRRFLGDWKREPAPSSGSSRPPQSPTLREAHKVWLKQVPRSATTLSDWKQVVEKFVALYGDLQIGQITKQQVAALRDSLFTNGDKVRSPATVKKLIGALASILQVQVDDGVLEINPANRIKIATTQNGPKPRDDFSLDELKTIFSSSVFSNGLRPIKAGGEASYWVFVLALYTGARVGELCQLDVDDIKTEAGVMFLEIHNRGEGKQLKTSNSQRIIPLHSSVLALGFDRYVGSLDARGRLFPDLKPLGKSRPSQRFSKWANQLIDDVGLTKRTLTFHSFRHTFVTAYRRVGIAEEIYQRLTGHVAGNVGRSYGRAELEPLKSAIDRIEFADLVIPVWQSGQLVKTYKRPKGT